MQFLFSLDRLNTPWAFLSRKVRCLDNSFHVSSAYFPQVCRFQVSGYPRENAALNKIVTDIEGVEMDHVTIQKRGMYRRVRNVPRI